MYESTLNDTFFTNIVFPLKERYRGTGIGALAAVNCLS